MTLIFPIRASVHCFNSMKSDISLNAGHRALVNVFWLLNTFLAVPLHKPNRNEPNKMPLLWSADAEMLRERALGGSTWQQRQSRVCCLLLPQCWHTRNTSALLVSDHLLYASAEAAMRDDPDFNISFVSLIEKQRCLFDFSCAEYNNRNIQERAWEKIAKEVSGSGKFRLFIYKMLRIDPVIN